MNSIIVLIIATILSIFSELRVFENWKNKKAVSFVIVFLFCLSLGLSIWLEFEKGDKEKEENVDRIQKFELTVSKLDSIIKTGETLNDSLAKELELQQFFGNKSNEILAKSVSIKKALMQDSLNSENTFDQQLEIVTNQLLGLSAKTRYYSMHPVKDSINFRKEILFILEQSIHLLGSQLNNPILKNNPDISIFWKEILGRFSFIQYRMLSYDEYTDGYALYNIDRTLDAFQNVLTEYFYRNNNSYRYNLKLKESLKIIRKQSEELRNKHIPDEYLFYQPLN